MKQTKYAYIASLLKQTEGRFFGVSFVKKDGSLRNLNGRLGVHSHLRNTEGYVSNRKADDPHIVVYDMVNKGYRSIHPDRIYALRVNGVTINLSNPKDIDQVKTGHDD